MPQQNIPSWNKVRSGPVKPRRYIPANVWSNIAIAFDFENEVFGLTSYSLNKHVSSKHVSCKQLVQSPKSEFHFLGQKQLQYYLQVCNYESLPESPHFESKMF